MATLPALIDLGKVSKPATVLIKKISGAVGALYEPHHIRRIAKANADAAIIEANAEIEITDIHRRAMLRFVQEEGRKQENIESITAKSISYLNEKSQPEELADDWITNFFDKGRMISDDQMQELWAKVLAGEANTPGSYSKRTLGVLASLDKQDALQFTNLCRCLWRMGNNTPVIYDIRASPYENVGITFSSVTHLDAIGLVRFEGIAGFQRTSIPKKTLVHYFDRPVILEFTKDKDNSLDLGHAILTQAGEELSSVCVSTPDDDVFLYVLKEWANRRVIVASPWPRAT